MAKKVKPRRIWVRYVCEKCGMKAAVKHGEGRFRCLECHSVYRPNSGKGCYTKKEYLVLKTLLQLFDFMQMKDKRNYKIPLKKFVEKVETHDVKDIKKLISVEVINKIETQQELRIVDTYVQDAVFITRDENNRFQIYRNFFKLDNSYVFKNGTIKIVRHGRYRSGDKKQELEEKFKKERERMRLKRIYPEKY